MTHVHRHHPLMALRRQSWCVPAALSLACAVAAIWWVVVTA